MLFQFAYSFGRNSETYGLEKMTVVNEKRRKLFHQIFEKQPLGVLNTEELAVVGKTKDGTRLIKIPRGTLIAFLRELQREGLVDHFSTKTFRYGFQFDNAVWSRIK
jgi:hypothetical protein